MKEASGCGNLAAQFQIVLSHLFTRNRNQFLALVVAEQNGVRHRLCPRLNRRPEDFGNTKRSNISSPARDARRLGLFALCPAHACC
jgi:hypothetical protein